MHAFRTELHPSPAPFQINHAHRLLLVGSCFSEHIGERLAERKFQTLANPFGIVYNPLSIARCIERLSDDYQAFTEGDLFENAGLWHSWDHHGRFSQPDKGKTLQGINAAYRDASEHLKKTDFLLLTFGSSDVFSLCETGKVVANNHKMPSALFTPRRLSVSEIVDSTLRALERAAQVAPQIIIVLTVSPVRHLRHGLVENQRSKAALVLACEAICARLDNAHYFPAYELLLDDLRDYRFYAPDMVHPSEVAADYVWAFFSSTFFEEDTRSLNDRIDKIRTAAQHRPFHPDTEQHRAFARAQLVAIAALKLERPGLDFKAEERVFMRSLAGGSG